MIELAKGIKIVLREQSGFPYGYCLYIEDEIRGLIDTGAGQKTLKQLKQSGIDLVLNTHYHRDHTIGNSIFAESKILIHRLDYPPLVDETARDFYTGFFEWESIVGSPRSALNTGAKSAAQFIPTPVNGFFNEDELIHFGRLTAKVIHLPGHTPGHCGFYFEKLGLIFAGDIDLTRLGPWYGDYTSNLDDLIDSIVKLKDMDTVVYCSSHRRPVTRGIKEEIESYMDIIHDRETRLRRLLKEPQSLDELTGKGIIFPDYGSAYLRFWERRMIEKHLDRMVRNREVEQVEPGRYRLVLG